MAVDAVSNKQAIPVSLNLSELVGLFPPGFVFGAATSAYQIEGAVTEDGRGESIWDRFAATPGNTYEGHTGAVACDHYHRYRQDVDLMADMGVQAYRFSTAWPRILPQGRGQTNSRGLDFYDRLVDSLLERGITPYPTLFHWDLPQALQDRGGWYSRSTTDAFAEYTEALVRRLGDRVYTWITHNEPWCSSWLGHGYGRNAPGLADGPTGAVTAAHHILLSHGKAVEVFRDLAPSAQVGITIDLYPMYPASSADEDARAAFKADGARNRWFLDPVIRGEYPNDLPDLLQHLPEGYESDMALIGSDLDFLGVNYYERQIIAADRSGEPTRVPDVNALHADNGREIFPAGLTAVLKRVHDDYGVKRVIVTENGIGDLDVVGSDGQVDDRKRIDFVQSHLQATAEAIKDGVNVEGFLVWSLLDNFEWSKGYDPRERYGIVYVDYETQARIVKRSGDWYRKLISCHRDRTSAT